ncbi:hypothetical protein C3941_00185 [Kaistia algarum]|uniref:tyrosine-type recombinase/integrase n=1 Tax=Kaistia algarum TaxID=2083279 RepID=UPI000CE8980F|nr:site-specific integrase [Kaistia algarum]MCX5513365.1 tyrosine-type recombinase/integrase [Kaistia algarum]PPE81186.1 hypothetical protein C3941_00185 [Kaistia algarum]
MVEKGGSGKTRPARPLTGPIVDKLKGEGEAYRVPDTRAQGLAIRVAVGGTKTWDLAFRIQGTGRTRRMSLGKFPGISVEDARRRARELVEAGQQGRDLVVEERDLAREEARQLSVSALIDEYVKRRVKGRLRTAKEIEARLKRGLNDILDMRAKDVRRRDVRDLLDACADEGLLREAEKRRQVSRAFFGWALSVDYIEIDPTAGLKAYDPGTPRDRVLSANEIKALWNWLGDLPPDHADVMRLQLLLGARVGEIGGMRKDEVDVEAWTWTLPAARSKNKKARITPLVGAARAIVEVRIGSRGALFTTEGGIALKATHIGTALSHRKNRLPIAHFRTHDLRRTVATGLADLGISLDLVAAVLGHEAGSSSTRTLARHYLRTDAVDRKKVALEAWDARVRAILAGDADLPANVVSITANAR